VAYAQTPFDITKSATVAAKEAKITCKKLAVAPNSCVISYFDEDFAVSKKASEYYRVLDGKTADGQFIATDYYSSGQRKTDTFTTSNLQALLTEGDNERLGMTQKSFTTYHANGTKKSEGSFNDGKKTGEWTDWHENGEVKAKSSFNDNGKLTGEWTVWYENGKIAQKGSCNDDGNPAGEWTFWHENGEVGFKGSYNNGNRTGEWTLWHENGKVLAKGSFNDNGKLTGEWTYWQENGEVGSKGSYNDDGKRTGEWIEWDESGKKIHTRIFDNGKLISVDGVIQQ
jgi:antitoxin component YwqK of YwqJK toxin-antitoxin module